MNIFETLFPERPDHRLVRLQTDDGFMSAYLPRTTNEWTALAAFHDERVKAAIHECKFHNSERATQLLAQLLCAHLARFQQRVVIVPLPLSRERQRERGYNQVTKVARCAASRLAGVTVNESVLFRRRHTAPQTSLSRKGRLQNLKDAFAADQVHAAALSDASIIILDDVVTTGATFAAAKVALLPHSPAPVSCIALAH